MSDDIQAVFKTTDYRTVTVGEAQTFINEGWEPHGSAMLDSYGSVIQPMVKRRVLTVDEYMEVVEIVVQAAILTQKKMQEKMEEGELLLG